MGFVTRINPYKELLCLPFYYLWIPTFVSWVLAIIKLLYIYFVVYLIKKLNYKKDNLETTITTQFLLDSRKELEIFVNKEDIQFPSEIISIIMEMLPDKYDNWKEFCDYNSIDKLIQRQKSVLRYSLYIYPILRIIANFINFILIMYQYGRWYHEHSNISNWDKYCAFVIALLYSPAHSGRGVSTLVTLNFGFGYMDSDYEHIEGVGEPLIGIDFSEFFLYVSLILIVSFPIWIGGVFIFIPTTVFFIVVGVIFSVIYHYAMKWIVWKDEYEFNWTLLARISILTIMMWFLVVILVSAMEFYDGQNWVDSCSIGFLGQYCDNDDFIDFSDWNEYTKDLQFLIVSWFLF